MRMIATIAGLAIAMAALPVAADAACQKRTNGTVIGALAGGLLGNTVAGRGDRTEGTLIGAAAGGLVGNQVSKCRSKPARTYSRARTYRDSGPERARYAGDASCTYSTRTYYDAYGRAVQQPTRICR